MPGANFFNSLEKQDRFVSANAFGIQVVRLPPNKWLHGRLPKFEGGFLLGRPNYYSGIPQKDLKNLIRILDQANQA